MHLHADGGRILKCLHQRYIKRLANRNDVRRNVSLRVLETDIRICSKVSRPGDGLCFFRLTVRNHFGYVGI